MQNSFINKLTQAIKRNNSLLCVGLDPNPQKYPQHFPDNIDAEALLNWGQNIIEQTTDLVCCYKPNFAFYEQYGLAGLEALQQTIAAIPADIPVLLDAKRGDIGSTAAAYAHAAFKVWGADAITLNPYLGQDSISPFLAYPGKMVFILCYTSNPSAKTVQEFGYAGDYLFEHIARQGQQWGTVEQVGFVIGATQPQALARFRQLNSSQDHWILAPGVGAQGGDLSAALTAGLSKQGSGLIVPVSRAIIYASNPREAALTLRANINQAQQNLNHPPQSNAHNVHKELILKLHEAGCVQFGEFTLASGKQSPIYIDLRRITASASLLKLVARAYASLLKPLSFDHLAAVPYAALPIGTAVALNSNKPLIYPRKEAKSYGTAKSIEGVFAPGDRVAIIEDLVTSAGSVLKVMETLKAAKLKVADVVVLIDREQGGRENLLKNGYNLHAVLSLSQILSTLQQAGRISAEQVVAVQGLGIGG